jgi:hypothetical protein
MKVRIPRGFKIFLVVLGWSTSSAAFALATIFQGQLLPRNINGGGLYADVTNGDPLVLLLFYGGSFAISILAALVISDVGVSLASFFSSYIGTGLITYFVLGLPDLFGVYDPLGVIQGSAVTFTFTALFPLLLFVSLAGTVAGMALAERFL